VGRARDIRLAYVLLAPAVMLLVTVLAYPIGWELWTSFTDLSPLNDGPTAFVGLENYRRLAADPTFWRAAAITAAFAAVTCAVKLALGLGLALLLARPFRGRALLRTLFLTPYALPVYAGVINESPTRTKK
jgi:multiple sugar transport system permease protein